MYPKIYLKNTPNLKIQARNTPTNHAANIDTFIADISLEMHTLHTCREIVSEFC